MKSLIAITFRMDSTIRDYLQLRAKRSDRSMNSEISAILRQLEEIEKASGPSLATDPDALQK